MRRYISGATTVCVLLMKKFGAHCSEKVHYLICRLARPLMLYLLLQWLPTSMMVLRVFQYYFLSSRRKKGKWRCCTYLIQMRQRGKPELNVCSKASRKTKLNPLSVWRRLLMKWITSYLFGAIQTFNLAEKKEKSNKNSVICKTGKTILYRQKNLTK